MAGQAGDVTVQPMMEKKALNMKTNIWSVDGGGTQAEGDSKVQKLKKTVLGQVKGQTLVFGPHHGD